MDFGPHAAEKVYQIHGTSKSFSSKPDALDEKASAAFREITQMGFDGLEVHADVFGVDPQQLPDGFFLSSDTSYWKLVFNNRHNKQDGKWKPFGPFLGYGIAYCGFGYQSFKNTFVYHKDNHRTNWIMVVYDLIHENSKIKTGDVKLCHVFQSDNYNPSCPNPYIDPNLFHRSEPITILDFRKEEVNSCMLQLEGLMMDPRSFNDDYDFEEVYEFNPIQANRRSGKRANVWERFTEIEVLGPDGEVMLTLAICHGCNMAYKTGKWDPRKRKFTNNGTNALVLHKCSGQHQISGDPQGAHH